MPPSQKITKEMILETGYALVEDSGIESVNSRSIAKVLHCSTQPVFSQFPGMEELRQNIHDFACDKFETDVLFNPLPGSFLRSSYCKVINLANEQSNVFRLIYLSQYCKGKDFLDSRMNFESNQKIFDEIKKKYQLNNSECTDILERISLLVQGIATLTATSSFRYNGEQVIELVEQTMEDMVMGIKRRR